MSAYSKTTVLVSCSCLCAGHELACSGKNVYTAKQQGYATHLPRPGSPNVHGRWRRALKTLRCEGVAAGTVDFLRQNDAIRSGALMYCADGGTHMHVVDILWCIVFALCHCVGVWRLYRLGSPQLPLPPQRFSGKVNGILCVCVCACVRYCKTSYRHAWICSWPSGRAL